MVACLGRLGHDTTVEGDPALALLLHRERVFDLVIVDWDTLGSGAPQLPIEALRTAPMGFIVCTSRPTDHSQALLAAGTPYLTPDESDALLDLHLGTMLARRNRRGRDHEALRFLVSASSQLASSLDYDTTLQSIGRLGVETLADGCVIDVIGPDGAARRVLAVARDPARQPMMELLLRYPLAAEPLRQLLANQKICVYRDAVPLEWPQFTSGEEHLRLWEALGHRAAALVPMIAHGRVEGVLTLTSREVTAFDSHAVGIAEQLGLRAGLAVANARLHQRAQEEIAQRRRVEEELRRSEEQLRALTDASLEAVVIHQDGQIILVNRAMASMLGYTVDEMVGSSAFRFIAPESHAAIRAQFALTSQATYEALALHKDGSKFPIEVEVRGASWKGRQVRMAAMRDIRERRRNQAQLIFADRLAAVGMLAAGVAHEINNPLAFVSLSVDFARHEIQRGGPREEILRALDDAAAGTRRVSGIVRDLGRISRVDDGRRGSVEIRPVLEAALGIARNEIRHRAVLTLDLREVPPVDASEARLGQVFLNLLINAAQAVPEGAPEKNAVRVATFEHASGRVAVEFSDSGSGISAEVRPRIFDPFFTTKPLGVGTGLGLSICQGIVASLGGEIEVESEPGKGATFRVLLPRAKGVAMPQALEPAPLLSSRPRVLVVDDEALMRKALLRLLQASCDATAVATGAEVLALLASGAHFDVLLCDLMMPGMTGKGLYEQLLVVAPELARRTAFLSGGAFTTETAEFLHRVQNPILQKPFLPAELFAVVRDLAG